MVEIETVHEFVVYGRQLKPGLVQPPHIQLAILANSPMHEQQVVMCSNIIHPL